jgi:tRNA pseudouridine38-40 synthase
MVRMLVGTMVEIALERRPTRDLPRLLEPADGLRTSPPAPAEGLYFIAAVYPDEWFTRLPDS